MGRVSGLKIVLPTTLTDATLPILKDDPVLTSGSLMLVDLANETGGVPAPDSDVANIAWRQAATVLGSGTKDTLAAKFRRSATFAASDGLLERTARGGLHAIISQTTLANGRGAILDAPDPIKAHILANPGHGYYFGMWAKLTRGAAGTNGAQRLKLSKAGVNWGQATLMLYYRTGWYVTPAPTTGNGNPGLPESRSTTNGSPNVATPVSERIAGAVSTGRPSPFYGGVAATTTISPPAGVTDFTAGAVFGALDAAMNPTAGNYPNSWALYRMYLEDLTISGRTFAQVEAIESAEYSKAFAPGGRYNGDTHTSPATIP